MAAYMGKRATRGSQVWARELRGRSQQYLRQQSSYAHLESEMTARKIRPIFDDLTPQYSFRLETALADFLPETRWVNMVLSLLFFLLLYFFFYPPKPGSFLPLAVARSREQAYTYHAMLVVVLTPRLFQVRQRYLLLLPSGC